MYESIQKLSKSLGISEIVSTLLFQRGYTTPESAYSFIYPNLSDITDPGRFVDMEIAVKRTVEAIKNRENILIFGDYDVDGITSTALLLKTLHFFSPNLYFYIPDRVEDGYGLNKHALDYAIEKGMNLAITVDCGIKDAELVKYAMEKGLDIIITDHHIPDTTIPGAIAVINPQRPENNFKLKEMAGVVVAWQFARAVVKAMTGKNSYLNDYLDLLTLGIIADRVPLIEDNRILASIGMKKLQNSKNLGIKSLIEVSGLNGRKIDSHTVGFIIAPRLNAAGRIESARLAVRLLTNTNTYKVKKIAAKLNQLNQKRQKLVENTLKEATEMIRMQGLHYNEGIVVYKEDWHIGVLGIVASKLVDKYKLPAIVCAKNKEFIKGSARSIEGLNIFESLKDVKEFLEGFGGHKGAAGIRMFPEQLEDFKLHWTRCLKNRLSDAKIIKKEYDMLLPADKISLRLAKEIELLEPFGEANPEPIFASKLPSGVEYLSINGYYKSTYKDCSILVPKGINPVGTVTFRLKVDRWQNRESVLVRVEKQIEGVI